MEFIAVIIIALCVGLHLWWHTRGKIDFTVSMVSILAAGIGLFVSSGFFDSVEAVESEMPVMVNTIFLITTILVVAYIIYLLVTRKKNSLISLFLAVPMLMVLEQRVPVDSRIISALLGATVLVTLQNAYDIYLVKEDEQ